MAEIMFSLKETRQIAQEVAVEVTTNVLKDIKEDISNMNVHMDEAEKAILSPDQIVDMTKKQAQIIIEGYINDANSLDK